MSEETRKEPNTVARKDFMASQNNNSTKGKSQDKLMRQIQTDNRELSKKEIKNIYKHNRIAQNLIDIPAEDATREWISLDFDNDDYEQTIMQKLNDLDAQNAYQQMMAYERKTGDGFLSIGANQAADFSLEDELNSNTLRDIEYIHPFSRWYIRGADIDENPFSETFGEFRHYYIDPAEESGERRKVHPDRIQHLQIRGLESEKWGIPLYLPLYDALTILDSTAWSLGQIAYSSVFKVLKSPDIDLSNADQWQDLQMMLEEEFNSNTLALIGKDDELTHEGPGNSLPNLESLITFVWEYLAGSARMPKSHLLGQQQGTITGGQYDSLNYYMRIAGLQESYLRPLIENLIDLLLMCNEIDVPEDAEYELSFNPLWRLDKQTDVEIRHTQAKIYEIYATKIGSHSPSEIREKIEGNKNITDELDLTKEELIEAGLDEDEIDDIENAISQNMQQYRKES